MKRLNCIVVFDKGKEHILFCRRMKDPNKDLYNFVGGKVEPGEDSADAAYRELYEETGIRRSDIHLSRFMDLTYYQQDFVLEMYVGQLHKEVTPVPESNPLLWLPLTEDFADSKRFAEDQNIAHIVNVALMFHLPEPACITEGTFIGVDGCRDGWIAAVIENGQIHIEFYETMEELLAAYPDPDRVLIDMAIGLPYSCDDLRPDDEARKFLGRKGSSIFPIPSKAAVYADGEEKQKEANQTALGKSLSKQSIAIIPKLRQLDSFMINHPEYQDKISESHPEVCFACLAGSPLLSNKKEFLGLTERTAVMASFLPDATMELILRTVEEMKQAHVKCAADDLADAICLALTACLDQQGKTRTIPEKPESNRDGLLMRMIIPSL